MYLIESECDELLRQLSGASSAGSQLAVELPMWRITAEAAETVARGVVDRSALAEIAATLPREPSAASEPSIADLAAWLGGHGWPATIDDVAHLFAASGRPVPAAFNTLT